jgi:valyl-tRNA synthetase
MSKSLGNIIDPLDIIEEFGADALRFSIISITASGQDVFLSKEKFYIGRNFANKIWNASRYVLMSLDGGNSLFSGVDWKKDLGEQLGARRGDCMYKLSLPHRWILSRLNRTVEAVTRSLTQLKFNDAANRIYEFFWHEFCDWYLELIKLGNGTTESTKSGHNEKETSLRDISQSILIEVLDTVLRLLHPFMPFITEEIRYRLQQAVTLTPGELPGIDKAEEGATLNHGACLESIMVSSWPKVHKNLIDPEVELYMDTVIPLISSIRNIRAEFNIPAGWYLSVVISVPTKVMENLLTEMQRYIKHLAKVKDLTIGRKIPKPQEAAVAAVGKIQTFVLLKGLIDFEQERTRLQGQIRELESQRELVTQKLSNETFLAKAPREVVKKQRGKLKDLNEKKSQLAERLKTLQ